MAEDLEIKAQLKNFENMLRLRNHVNSMLKYDLKGTQLSLREYELLMYIYQHGQTGTSELAQAFKVTQTLISRTVGQLMRAKLIQEQTYLDDRRRVNISLTETGLRQVIEAKKQVSNNLKNVDLTKQITSLSQ